MMFTFVVSLVLVAMVAHDLPRVWRFLHPTWLTFTVEPLGLKGVPAAYAIVAFLISAVNKVELLCINKVGGRAAAIEHPLVANESGGIIKMRG